MSLIEEWFRFDSEADCLAVWLIDELIDSQIDFSDLSTDTINYE